MHYLFLLFSFLATSIYASPNYSKDTSKIQKILASKYLQGVQVGIEIYNVTDQELLFTKNRNQLFSVASNNKIITSYAAFAILGRSYRHKTQVKAVGTIKNGVLKGDLVVIGHGDPNISGRFHPSTLSIPEQWAKKLKSKGITTIEGDLLAQDQDFDRDYIAQGWPKDQLLKWYSAQISALSFNDNCIKISVSPGSSIGSPIQIRTDPPTQFLTLHNKMKTVSKGTSYRFAIDRKLGTNEVYVYGRLPVGAPTYHAELTVHNPALYLITVFKEALEREGIQIKGKLGFEKKVRRGKVLASTSHNLFKTLQTINKRSQNFYAEQLFKIIGRHKFGKGSFENGSKAVSQFLTKEGFKDFQVVDGSGLSRGNKYSPEVMVGILRKIYNHPDRDYYVSTLPISGIDGTMRKRLKGKYKNKARAKTGYIANVSALSGFVRTRSNKVYAFSFFFNGFTRGKYPASNSTMKQIQDNILKTLINEY